jgi:hypothetical protein
MILSEKERILGRWVEHFDELLNTNVCDQWKDMATIESQENPEIAEPVLTTAKVEEAIKKLKKNKAPGMDLIQAELVKYAGPEYINHLLQVLPRYELVKQTLRDGIGASYALSIRKAM